MGLWTGIGMVASTWIGTEMLGKFGPDFLKKMDNKVICVVVGVAAGLLFKLGGQIGSVDVPMSWLDAGVYGYISSLCAGVAHDKNLKDLLMTKTSDMLGK